MTDSSVAVLIIRRTPTWRAGIGLARESASVGSQPKVFSGAGSGQGPAGGDPALRLAGGCSDVLEICVLVHDDRPIEFGDRCRENVHNAGGGRRPHLTHIHGILHEEKYHPIPRPNRDLLG